MILSSFEMSLFGFVELDVIRDSSQSLNDAAGNPAIARPGSLASQNGRTTISIRDSRLGLRMKGPGTAAVKTSGLIETDFLGNQPQSGPAPGGSPAVSETAYFTNPTFRARQFFVRLATPYVDVLAGQTWSLFGWQGFFFPNTVQIPGVPGELSSRTPQLRLSHLFGGITAGLEVAAAISRPAERDADVPDGTAGLRFILNRWKGLRTFGATGTGVDPLSVGVSGIIRRLRVPEYSATPSSTRSALGYGVSVDALLPVVPGNGELGENALTVTASYVRGRAISDQYAGFTGGVTFPALAAGTYPQNIDNGLLSYSPDGVLHTVGWQSFIVGAQYYLPLPIRAFVSVNYSRISSSDVGALVTADNPSTAARIFNRTDWADANVFVDANGAVRFGVEFAWTRQTYLDGVRASNKRAQLGIFYVF